MNKRHPYNSIIERKLEQLPVADADLLWNDMHSILDKKMPQKKERRRFVAWFLSSKYLVLLTVAFFIFLAPSLFYLSTKKSSTATIKKLNSSSQSDKLIENAVEKVSRDHNQIIKTGSEPNQKNSNNLSTAVTLASAVDHVIDNGFTSEQTIIPSEKYPTKDQINEPIQAIPNASANLGITRVNLKSISIYQDFLISINHNEKKDSLNQQLQSVINNIKKNTRNKSDKGFYAGIISGVDLSSIHFRSVKIGASKGFIIGYALNKKWSIESGLFWDIKRVYDNGSFFNPPGYTPSSGITITAVNGKSRLYELPVNMKYTIISGKNNLFATTGLSSYLMRSENYDYEYTLNNQPGGHNYLNYKNETKNWFSIVNFSLGYTHKLGTDGSFRIEPYLKLPIKDLGVGNMPIMSTGLNIGFTKKLR